MSSEVPQDEQPAKRWRPLTSVQRRVVGVLIEKAKTTPDAYPLTLNALTNGCNQKSNRSPQMDLSTDEVEQAIEDLREMGAVTEVQAGGRVAKFRHYMYEWLGVGKAELAVMAELLLRGEQTVGELRGRAARMEPIDDLQELRPILASLLEKDLIVELTTAGRGQVVTHNLYSPERLEELRREYAAGHAPATKSASSTVSAPTSSTASGLAQLQAEIAELRAEVSELRDQLERLTHGD